MIRVALLLNDGTLYWIPDSSKRHCPPNSIRFNHFVDTAAWGFFTISESNQTRWFLWALFFMFKEDSCVCSNGHNRFGDWKTTLMRSGLLYLSDLPLRLFSRKMPLQYYFSGGRFSWYLPVEVHRVVTKQVTPAAILWRRFCFLQQNIPSFTSVTSPLLAATQSNYAINRLGCAYLYIRLGVLSWNRL